MHDAAHKVVLLDRDGTINVDHGYVGRVSDWQLTERAAEALQMLCRAGFRTAIVTNQSGIARGLFSMRDVLRLHTHLRRQLATYGVMIDAIAVCPHVAEAGRNCRKPATGMIEQIESQLNGSIDYSSS